MPKHRIAINSMYGYRVRRFFFEGYVFGNRVIGFG